MIRQISLMLVSRCFRIGEMEFKWQFLRGERCAFQLQNSKYVVKLMWAKVSSAYAHKSQPQQSKKKNYLHGFSQAIYFSFFSVEIFIICFVSLLARNYDSFLFASDY